MALEFSSAGVEVRYCVETTSGTRPTSGYTVIPNIKSTPDYNSEPGTLDVTDLSDKIYKRSIAALRDVEGAIAFGVNLTASFMSAWRSCVSAAETAKLASKSTWFEIYIPNFESFYFSGMPQDLGLKAMEVDSVIEADAYVTPNQIVGWAANSTSAIS